MRFACWVILYFCRLLTVFKNNFFEIFFQEYHQSANSLDPDQARHFVGPYLSPNCLQRSPADDTSRQRINMLFQQMQQIYMAQVF